MSVCTNVQIETNVDYVPFSTANISELTFFGTGYYMPFYPIISTKSLFRVIITVINMLPTKY